MRRGRPSPLLDTKISDILRRETQSVPLLPTVHYLRHSPHGESHRKAVFPVFLGA